MTLIGTVIHQAETTICLGWKKNKRGGKRVKIVANSLRVAFLRPINNPDVDDWRGTILNVSLTPQRETVDWFSSDVMKLSTKD